MSPKIKIGAYAVLLILAVWFFLGFYSNYNTATKTAPDPDSSTNAPASTNGPAPQQNSSAPSRSGAARGAMIVYLAAFVAAAIGLGLLLASDITHFIGSKAVDYIFDEVGEAMRDPEYERAEAEWSNGKYLDAIQMMRDYLKKDPRQIHAALRIAEIYEKDLKNYLAAALEYEEILKQKLPPERWGWAAIHLCNLYSRRHQPDKAVALLRRVADEYPKTGAAKKARVRLGITEPQGEITEGEVVADPNAEATGDTPVITIDKAPAPLPPEPPPEEAQAPEPPKPNLPPGFRPKK